MASTTAPAGAPDTPVPAAAAAKAARRPWPNDRVQNAWYARTLDLLRAAGAIRDWRRGGVWVLLDAPRARDRVTLRPDFEVVRNDGSLRAVDFKGCLTREFRLKAKLWRAVYPAVPLYVVRADGSEVPA